MRGGRRSYRRARKDFRMAKKESTQHVLGRVRAPRVQITYDVEVGDATETKELPFVVGVLADLSGNPTEQLPRMKERKFVSIDRDNFDDVLAGAKPRVACRVDNKLAGDESQLSVELNFKSMDDFSPEQVVQQVEPLRKLLEIRQQLSDLRNKMAGNEKFEDLLQEVLSDTSKLQAAAREANGKGNGG
jgi:type VI secretion system protein ImpB